MAEPAPARYDTIGLGYQNHRRPDHRIAAQIHAALAGAEHVLDVGAGAGSYEPATATVVAVDPSPVMLAQNGNDRRIRAVAEKLPFPDTAFDAALASLTVHHWPDPAAGLAEVRRVSGRQVVFCFESEREHDMWVVAEYFPGIAGQVAPAASAAAIAAALGTDRIEAVPVPHDCADGFLAAYWRRPERYLEPDTWRAISGLALLPPAERDAGLARLQRDLDDGTWRRRHADLLDRDEMDYGYRLVVAG